MNDILPSEKYQPITDDIRFTNLIPQKILKVIVNESTCETKPLGYFDAYSGVIVTRWGFNDDIHPDYDYYSFHTDIEQWKEIITLMEDNGYDYKIISELPDGKKPSNYLEDLARTFFGLDIN